MDTMSKKPKLKMCFLARPKTAQIVTEVESQSDKHEPADI